MNIELTMQDQMENPFLASLLATIDEEEVNDFEVKTEGLTITSSDQANYYIKKVKELREERKQAAEAAKKALDYYKQKIDAWQQSQDKPLAAKELFFSTMLEEYAKKALTGSDKNSMKLIEGSIRFTKQQAVYKYDAELEEKTLAFLRKNAPQMIKVEESVKKSDVKKAGHVIGQSLYICDQEVPGVTVVQQDRKFEVI